MIKFTEITKTFRFSHGVYQALRGVSFEIKTGETVAVIGPSGSGKTTTMNIMGLLDRPTSGEYLLNNQSVSYLSFQEKAVLRNKMIGFVFQSFNLLPLMTALQNVMLTLHYAGVKPLLAREKALYHLEQVGMRDYASHRPSELSGGQQQRVAIARALVNDPLLILADEPSGALDSHTSGQVMEVLLGHGGQTTIVIITHDEEVARMCARQIPIRDGVVAL